MENAFLRVSGSTKKTRERIKSNIIYSIYCIYILSTILLISSRDFIRNNNIKRDFIQYQSIRSEIRYAEKNKTPEKSSRIFDSEKKI